MKKKTILQSNFNIKIFYCCTRVVSVYMYTITFTAFRSVRPAARGQSDAQGWYGS